MDKVWFWLAIGALCATVSWWIYRGRVEADASLFLGVFCLIASLKGRVKDAIFAWAVQAEEWQVALETRRVCTYAAGILDWDLKII